MFCQQFQNDVGRTRAQGLKVAIIEGHDIGGTCVNRGCVPSKALLAASGRVRELQNTMHLKSMGIQVTPLGSVRPALGAACNWRLHLGRVVLPVVGVCTAVLPPAAAHRPGVRSLV